jgi:hypothetical protein
MFHPKGEILRFKGPNAAKRMAHVEAELAGFVTRVSANELRVTQDINYKPAARAFDGGKAPALSLATS